MRRFALALGIASIFIFGFCPRVAAKPYFSTLVELTRNSSQIITGTALEVRNGTLLLQPDKSHKGGIPANPVEVELPKPEWEVAIPDYKAGNTLLLFTKSTTTKLAPYVGPQGLLILSKDQAAQYESAIAKILEYDVSASTTQKRERLYAMLKGNNPLLKRVAMWDFIFINRDGEAKVKDDVLPILGKIALEPDQPLANMATSTIGHLGGPKSIPILKKILSRSSDHYVRENAESILRTNRN